MQQSDGTTNDNPPRLRWAAGGAQPATVVLQGKRRPLSRVQKVVAKPHIKHPKQRPAQPHHRRQRPSLGRSAGLFAARCDA